LYKRDGLLLKKATIVCSFINTETQFQLAPGEDFPLDLQAVDELGHEVTSVVFVSEIDQVNDTSNAILKDDIYVLSPNETVPFSITVPETLYNETKNNKVKEKRKIQFSDPFSTLINGYSFDVELQTCRPGFIFSKDSQSCVCNTELDAVQRL